MDFDSELGIKWPCFGEYHCKVCNRKWASSKAWKLYGQKCIVCDATIQAMNLRQLFRYYCLDCDKLWKSKWEDDGAKCRECGEIVRPFKTHAEFKKFEAEYILPHKLDTDLPIDDSQPHLSDLCEKCKKSGRNCSTGKPLISSSSAAPTPTPLRAVTLSNMAALSQIEKLPKVRNWSDLPPPPPPPVVNPWNRFHPTPKQPVPVVLVAKIKPQTPTKPSPPEMPKQCNGIIINSAAATTNTRCNGIVPNGNHDGHTQPAIPISPVKPKHKSMNGISNGKMLDQDRDDNNVNRIDYTSNRQNIHADERTLLNLWNCSIQ